MCVASRALLATGLRALTRVRRGRADDNLPKGRERDVPGLREIFGSDHSQLPGKVIR